MRLRRPVGDRLRGVDVLGSGGPARHPCEHRLAARRTDLDVELVAVLVEELGEGEVETRLCAWSGVHRHAEARPARFAALHRDDERVASRAA